MSFDDEIRAKEKANQAHRDDKLSRAKERNARRLEAQRRLDELAAEVIAQCKKRGRDVGAVAKYTSSDFFVERFHFKLKPGPRVWAIGGFLLGDDGKFYIGQTLTQNAGRLEKRFQRDRDRALRRHNVAFLIADLGPLTVSGEPHAMDSEFHGTSVMLFSGELFVQGYRDPLPRLLAHSFARG